MFKFNKFYFALAVLLFNAEVLIADFMHDAFIRPYGGDFLVVILIYCAFKAFIKSDLWLTVIGVLVFSYVVETTQYYHLINRLGWENSSLARNILGTTFRWADMLAYTLGMLLVVVIEIWLSRVKAFRGEAKNGY
ncbi:ribosomal maturation YjgA family protein [Mucilaginibacter psychrotolerans]|uniref:DUF2809 domain-containing protein n=1 Tax=Mucilaginibacter psychrotolerans TaxID=1524096 RepID=A0A4Y8SDG5_9SPHI|nr:DUF2809 domain-containing protein [Mucilaginibacter psychrotolerans]TFF37123.1 DUF2809 domain-containing protein [Mucilaginibacter psychrotolerans]